MLACLLIARNFHKLDGFFEGRQNPDHSKKRCGSEKLRYLMSFIITGLDLGESFYVSHGSFGLHLSTVISVKLLLEFTSIFKSL